MYCDTSEVHTGMYYLCVMFSFFSLSKGGRVIVMSIHQPCYSIFRLCDHITLISRGNVIYAGAGKATLPYFTNVLGKSQCLCLRSYIASYVLLVLTVTENVYLHIIRS